MVHEPNPQSDGAAKTAETDTRGGVGLAVRGSSRGGGAGRTGALVSAALIPNWRRSWRMLSVQVAALAVLFGSLPPDQQSAILAWLGLAPERIPAVLGGLFMVTRLVSQPKVQE
jgi:hypothetical protein